MEVSNILIVVVDVCLIDGPLLRVHLFFNDTICNKGVFFFHNRPVTYLLLQ